MADPLTPDEPPRETLSLGGSSGGSRLDTLVTRLRASSKPTVLTAATLLLGFAVFATVHFTGASGGVAADRQPAPDQPVASVAAPSRAPEPASELNLDHVWVGYHDVMVSVPRSWAGSDSLSCGTTATPRSVSPRDPQSKCSATPAQQRSTVLWIRHDVDQAELRRNGYVERSVVGQPFFAAPIEKAGSAYLQYVAFPELDTLVVLRSPTEATIEQLLRSMRGIPHSWVSVPDLRGHAPQQALTTLGDLDLVGRAAHNSGMAMPAETVVVGQFPASGQVVKARTDVTVAVLPADHGR